MSVMPVLTEDCAFTFCQKTHYDPFAAYYNTLHLLRPREILNFKFEHLKVLNIFIYEILTLGVCVFRSGPVSL